MAVTVQDVKAFFPELTASDAVIGQWLGVASGRHNAEAFGSQSDFALTALTAHLVTLHERRMTRGIVAPGAIRSYTVDRVTTTYAVPSPSGGASSDASLASTPAGQLYLETREGIFADRRV